MRPAFRNTELSVTDQFVDLVDIGYVFSSLVAVVAEEDTFANWSLDEMVHEEQHNSEVVESLTNELLALFEGKQIL